MIKTALQLEKTSVVGLFFVRCKSVLAHDEDFKENIHKDKDIKKYLSDKEIDDCFDYEYYLRNIDLIMKRFGI